MARLLKLKLSGMNTQVEHDAIRSTKQFALDVETAACEALFYTVAVSCIGLTGEWSPGEKSFPSTHVRVLSVISNMRKQAKLHKIEGFAP